VARGVCEVDDNGYLSRIDERLKIGRHEGGIAFAGDDGSMIPVPEESIVSMNFWGFPRSFLDDARDGFSEFLTDVMPLNPLKAEYLLPHKVGDLLSSGRAAVKVLPSDDRWFGVTYKEDREPTAAALQSLKDKGFYPEILWR